MLKDERAIGAALANLAYLAWCEGRRREALELYSSAVERVRLSGDLMFTGMFLSTLGWYMVADGDLQGADECKEEGLAILRGLDAREGVGLALLGLARVVHREGDALRLRALLTESSDLLRDTDSPGLIDWIRFVGHIEVLRGEHALGLRLLAAGDSAGPLFGSYRALFYLMPRNEFQESVAAARAQLGADVIDRIWEQGKLMTIDQAVTAALEVMDAEWQGAARPDSVPAAGSPLTPRQQEVALLIAQGLTNRQIAVRLVITPRAAAAHVEHILDKLGVSSRTQVGVWVSERGMLTAPSNVSSSR
jgi:non-specific serine/threonine protein kinase